ncbi:hypothetical protein BB560_001662 [Smittium megazygosporum]|uniref:Uncharacterized protein n=1 Tax=Smittium megazygosporum TaxID=133381 RepID=A0A2T9ZGY2_9FUNG|nr:hypothetical protein BB560_001662 [Smittium megazygosporum]
MDHSEGWATDAAKVSLVGAGIGLVVSTTKNIMSSNSPGISGIFTVHGSSIGLYAVIGGVFAGTRGLSAEIRKKDDYINTGIAGCAAGLIIGLRKRSLPSAVGRCAFLSSSLGFIDYTGGLTNKIDELSAEERERIRASVFGAKDRPINSDKD